jgi:hypothetical protein
VGPLSRCRLDREFFLKKQQLAAQGGAVPAAHNGVPVAHTALSNEGLAIALSHAFGKPVGKSFASTPVPAEFVETDVRTWYRVMDTAEGVMGLKNTLCLSLAGSSNTKRMEKFKL